MSLPFNLQKLPPEALDVLRYLGNTSAATADDIESGTGIAARTIGKAIRRLVNYDYILLGASGAYQLTTDGTLAVKQLAEYDAAVAAAGGLPQKKETPKVQRRLTVVLPRSLGAGRQTDIYIGVNPPTDNNKLPGNAHVELKLSAVNGSLSAGNIALEIPPDRAAQPGKVSLTPAQPGRAVRLRVDAFQAFEFDSMEPLGGMYFDIQVSMDSTPKDSSTRAVGMDLLLHPPR
jgi:hypothetical protein